jgi:hypothetical protein
MHRSRQPHHALAAAKLTAGAAALAAATACGDGTPFEVAGGRRALVGSWQSRAEPISPSGTWRRSLVVYRDLRVESRGVTYGLYPGDGPTTVSASSTLYGSLGATDRKYIVRPDSLVTEDSFGGSLRRTVQRDFTWWAADSVEYTVRGDRLEIGYYTYPADAPVLTHDVLYRVR